MKPIVHSYVGKIARTPAPPCECGPGGCAAAYGMDGDEPEHDYTFQCAECLRVVPYCYGGAESPGNHADVLCNDCYCVLEHLREKLASLLLQRAAPYAQFRIGRVERWVADGREESGPWSVRFMQPLPWLPLDVEPLIERVLQHVNRESQRAHFQTELGALERAYRSWERWGL